MEGYKSYNEIVPMLTGLKRKNKIGKVNWFKSTVIRLYQNNFEMNCRCV